VATPRRAARMRGIGWNVNIGQAPRVRTTSDQERIAIAIGIESEWVQAGVDPPCHHGRVARETRARGDTRCTDQGKGRLARCLNRGQSCERRTLRGLGVPSGKGKRGLRPGRCTRPAGLGGCGSLPFPPRTPNPLRLRGVKGFVRQGSRTSVIGHVRLLALRLSKPHQDAGALLLATATCSSRHLGDFGTAR